MSRRALGEEQLRVRKHRPPGSTPNPFPLRCGCSPTSLYLGFVDRKTDSNTCKTGGEWKALCDLWRKCRLLTYANNVLFWARPGATATRVAWETSARNTQSTPVSKPGLWVQLAADKGPLCPAVCALLTLRPGFWSPFADHTCISATCQGRPAWSPVHSPLSLLKGSLGGWPLQGKGFYSGHARRGGAYGVYARVGQEHPLQGGASRVRAGVRQFVVCLGQKENRAK